MSNRNKIYSKGRIQGQFTALRYEVMDSAAWKQMSMGARMLYIALIKPLSFNADNNGKVFLATRRAAVELGASQRRVCVWFRELEHYGFIVLTYPGTTMTAARWRITDVGWGRLDGKGIEPTKDYLRWDGVLFERHNPDGTITKSGRQKSKRDRNQNGSSIKNTPERVTKKSPHFEEKKSSEGVRTKSPRLTPKSRTKSPQKEAPPCEDLKSSDLGQPSPHLEKAPLAAKQAEWTTPRLTELPWSEEVCRYCRLPASRYALTELRQDFYVHPDCVAEWRKQRSGALAEIGGLGQ